MNDGPNKLARIGVVLLLATASFPAAASDNLADYINIMTLPGFPARDGLPATTQRTLTTADFAIIQKCKDDVVAGHTYPAVDDNEPVVPPGLMNPLLVRHVLMLNRCVEAAGMKDVVIVAIPNGVAHAQLR